MPEDDTQSHVRRTQRLTSKSDRNLGGRNLRLATATGLTMASLVVGLLFLGSEPFFGLAFVVLLIAQGEFYVAARKAGHMPATALGLVAGAMIVLGVFFKGPAAAAIVIFLTLVFCVVWYMAVESRDALLTNLGVTILGVVYVPVLGAFVGLLASRPDGRGVTIAALGGTVIYDVTAYLAGAKIGKRPLAPTISPNKTREGALVATLCVVLAAALFGPLLGPWSLGQALLVGLLIAVAAPVGDLFESMLKRDLGIKDMGTIFPGHGGALDRIDAMLFVAPAVFLSLELFRL